MTATRPCVECHRERPLEDFGARGTTARGTVRTRYSRCRDCRRAQRIAQVRARGEEPPLPIGPWRAFLDTLTVIYGDEELLAAAMGVPARRLRAWRHKTKTIRLDNADRCLCNLDMPHKLRELWPELYDLPELEEAA